MSYSTKKSLVRVVVNYEAAVKTFCMSGKELKKYMKHVNISEKNAIYHGQEEKIAQGPAQY